MEICCEEPPHPSPLPEGEGIDRGGFKRYADLKVLSRTQVLKGMKICSLSPSPPLGERAGVRGMDVAAYIYPTAEMQNANPKVGVLFS